MTTEECLLSPGRNPDMSKEEIETGLCDYLGVEKVVWLGRGFDPDETTGHVDDVACYVRPGVVAIAWTDDPEDWRYEIMRDNLERLELATDARGRRLEIAKLPCPTDVTITEDEAWGVDAVEGTLPRTAGRPHAGHLRQLLHLQRRRRDAGVRRSPGRDGTRRRCSGSSRSARSSRCPGARSCSAAATCTASPSSSRERSGPRGTRGDDRAFVRHE